MTRVAPGAGAVIDWDMAHRVALRFSRRQPFTDSAMQAELESSFMVATAQAEKHVAAETGLISAFGPARAVVTDRPGWIDANLASFQRLLRPLTDRLPKAWVPFGGVPLLSRQTAVLRRAGVTDLSIVTGYQAHAFDGCGARLFNNPRFASTNMMASLLCAKPLFDGDDDVVVAYGDIVYEPQVLQTLLATAAPVAVVVDLGWQSLWRLRMDDPLTDAETMKLDTAGNIVELGRKPHTLDEIEGQYIGLFKVDRRFAPAFFERYEQLPEGVLFEGRPRDKMFMTSYLQLQIDQGVQVRAATVTHGWLEVDSVDDLRRYEDALARGRLNELYDGAA